MGHNKTDTDEDLERLKEYLDRDDGHEVERQQQLIHGLWSGTTDLQLPEDTPSGQVKIEDSIMIFRCHALFIQLDRSHRFHPSNYTLERFHRISHSRV